MPFVEHPVFAQPDNEDHVVWRYYDATQFISLLQNRGLYFNRSDNFSDPFEGIYPKERIEREYARNLFRKITEEIRVENNHYPEEAVRENPEEEALRVSDHFRARSYMNCWHTNDSESMAMWKSYIDSGDGVLIKSTYSKLKSAIDIYDEYQYRMGKVDYLPWFDDKVEQELDDREQNNALYPFMYKQEEYEYENEVRVIISRSEGGDGFFVKTDLNELIDEVIISPNSPPWSDIQFWENILRKYRLRSDVTKSDLETTPEDIIENIDRGQIEKEVAEKVEEWKESQDFID